MWCGGCETLPLCDPGGTAASSVVVGSSSSFSVRSFGTTLHPCIPLSILQLRQRLLVIWYSSGSSSRLLLAPMPSLIPSGLPRFRLFQVLTLSLLFPFYTVSSPLHFALLLLSFSSCNLLHHHFRWRQLTLPFSLFSSPSTSS